MSRSRMRWGGAAAALVTAVIACGASAAPAAAAGGLPGEYAFTEPTGITAPDGSARYYAISAQGGGTDVLAVDLSDETAPGEPTMGKIHLDDRLSVPGVALDGATSGISVDGRTLVLAAARQGFPVEESRFVVLGTERLHRTSTIDLDGNFSFDSMSPDGSILYLVHYLSKLDSSKYEVRAFDVARDRLLRRPILDSRTAPVVMRGNPVARAMSPDGVWAYTLYDGAGKTPFVHALNTAEGTALCIDVDALANTRVYHLGLVPSADGGTLTINDPRKGTVASIETGSWKVTEPGDEPAAAPSDEGGGGVPWAGLTAIAVGVALIGGGWVARRRRRGGSDEPELPPDPELEPEPERVGAADR